MIKKTVIKLIKFFEKAMYFIISPFLCKKTDMSPEKAYEILCSATPKPQGDAVCENKISEEKKYDLTVIIPCYNVEKYVKECFDSLFSQKTKHKIKVIIINDGSTDSTGKIIEEYNYPENFTVEIINQQNKGLSNARNNGLKFIESNYVTFIDSDDYIFPDSLEKMLDAAYKNDADLIEGNYSLLLGKQLTPINVHGALKTDDFMNLVGFPWLKLIKSEFFENVCFPEGYWYEDTIMMFLIHPSCRRIFTTDVMLYAYRQREGSIVKSSIGKPRAAETYWITELMVEDRKRLGMRFDGKMIDAFMRQIICNADRLQHLQKEVREAAFVKTRELLKEFPEDAVPSKKYRRLYNAVKKGRFKDCELFCKTY